MTEAVGDQTFSRIVALIRKFTPYPDRDITMQTVIQTDLGIEGEDGYALIQAIKDEWSVDFSTFDDRYFWDDFSNSLFLLLWPIAPLIWSGMKFTGRGRKIDLTVSDLVNAINSGQWKHPVRSPKFPWERKRAK